MYKVLIVDDEMKIVQGLTKGVDWNKWNCQVVGSAMDGIQGLHLVDEHQPDLIFADIQMPNVDGLTMIASIKSRFPRIQIAVLTGYRDFDYAQRALNLGVTRFLLKPSKFSEIEEAITAMVENCSTLEDVTETSQPMRSSLEGEGPSAGNFIVQKALIYMKEHHQENLKLEQVANQVYVSQWHLSKLLNAYTKRSYSQILNGYRIEQAKLLLRDPSLRVSDIALRSGFVDVPHFSRVFKKKVGVSATEYRNACI